MPPDSIAKTIDQGRMLELGVKFLLAYFVGSIMGSMVIGALKGGVDIRTMGSGNAGGTNALRTQGKLFALGVIIIDIGKGALGAGVIPMLALPFVPADPEVPRPLLVYACAAAAAIGHVWPMWHRFRGGKGAATVLGTIFVLAPMLFVPVFLVWLLVLTTTGFVGLGTMAAGLAGPAWIAATRLPNDQGLFWYTLFCGVFMLYTHRSNIQRMLDGTEHRNPKIMLLGRGRG